MKKFLVAALIASLSLGMSVSTVEAKRLGGGTSQGMKRAPAPTPAQPAQPATPTNPNHAAATPAANPAMAQAAAPKRSWMGPIAGIAAGLGIAALMSHLGLGAGMGNFLVMLLIAVAAFFVIRMVMRSFRKPSAAGNGMAFAGANPAYVPPAQAQGDFVNAGASGGTSAPVQPLVETPLVPANVDAEAIERAAKVMFVRLQAANDAGNVDDLREFSTPEMFASFKVDLTERQGGQQTDVMRLDARLFEFAEENGQQIASVRYQGLIREQAGLAQPFDETWHLVRPVGSAADTPWKIAGILQAA